MASELPQKKRFISLRVKLLVGFTLLFMVVFAIAFYWFYTFATDVAMRQIEEDMLTTLEGGLKGIDGDAFVALAEEAELRDDGLSDDPRYWDHMAWIETIHDLEPRANPYSWVRGDPNVQNEVLFIGDILRVTQPENATVFREPYITQGSMITGMLTLWEDLEPYQDDWGHWISAYAPILNSAGESVGGLGIDFRADYVYQVQDSIEDRILISFAITYLALFVLVYLISRTLTGPIISLTGVARGVADGNYDQDISKLYGGKTQDEVDALAQVFELMVSKVRAREEGLKRQVQQLRIEIDEVKRTRQVEEITGSDYFTTLKEKARVLRQQSVTDGGVEES
ncbi:MAG: HAMP domain-containing protein [Anaerolineae bacterium]|nr:HAMP domain-containing protein [Anaerolineae bacterium]